MNKKWLLLLALLLNHTLITSVLAAVHSSSEGHIGYEAAHFHLTALTRADQLHSHGGHGEHSADQSAENSDEHDHEGTAHVHVPCNHCAVPFVISPPQQTAALLPPSFSLPNYLSQAYKPAVPPPNA